MFTEEYKQKIYRKWVEKGRPWFNIDPSKEATPEEREIVAELHKREAKIRPKPTEKKEVKAFDRLMQGLDNC